MATKRDVIVDTTENTPSSTVDTVKFAFYVWLSREQGKQSSADAIIASLDIASEQLLKRKIAVVPIWELTKSTIFATIYNNARNHKFFRIMDNKIYSSFMRDGQLYLKFLKSKPVLRSASYAPENQPAVGRKVAEKLTIKEAVSRILSEARQAMTTDEIYLEIIARKLYTFELNRSRGGSVRATKAISRRKASPLQLRYGLTTVNQKKEMLFHDRATSARENVGGYPA